MRSAGAEVHAREGDCEEDLEETITVPLEDKDTRLVVKLRPTPNLFSV